MSVEIELFRSFFKTCNDSVAILRVNDECFVRVNPALCKFTGYQAYELIGKTPRSLNLFFNFDEYKKLNQSLENDKKVQDLRLTIITKEGRERFISLSANLIEVQGILYTIINFREKSEENIQEDPALQNYDNFKHIVQNLGLGVTILNKDLKIIYINQKMKEWFPDIRIKPSSYCYMEFNDPPRDTPCTYCPTIKTIEDGEIHEAITDTPAGSEVKHYRIISAPIKNNKGELICVAETVEDITIEQEAVEEKKLLLDQLRHADRLATLGQFSTYLAHDLNEPLTNILGFSQLIKRNVTLSDETVKDIDKIINSALQARMIVKRILSFSKPISGDKVMVNLNKIVNETILFFQNRCREKGIRIHTILRPDLLEIEVNPSQFMQVIVNLVVNAMEAMPKGGSLTIRTLNIGNGISILVEDTGHGMSPEVRRNIFKPFFTTKSQTEGTGLGLSVVHEIVRSHTGTIDIGTRSGHGTRFRINIPETQVSLNDNILSMNNKSHKHEPNLMT